MVMDLDTCMDMDIIMLILTMDTIIMIITITMVTMMIIMITTMVMHIPMCLFIAMDSKDTIIE